MCFSKAVVKYRIPILILTVLLMIPAVIGIANTRINYDMLNYLPEDMDISRSYRYILKDKFPQNSNGKYRHAVLERYCCV